MHPAHVSADDDYMWDHPEHTGLDRNELQAKENMEYNRRTHGETTERRYVCVSEPMFNRIRLYTLHHSSIPGKYEQHVMLALILMTTCVTARTASLA
jgi:hypothetical protein